MSETPCLRGELQRTLSLNTSVLRQNQGMIDPMTRTPNARVKAMTATFDDQEESSSSGNQIREETMLEAAVPPAHLHCG